MDALKSANDVLSEAVRTSTGEAREGVARVYAEFIDEWCGKAVDDSLVSSRLVPPLPRGAGTFLVLPRKVCPILHAVV